MEMCVGGCGGFDCGECQVGRGQAKGVQAVRGRGHTGPWGMGMAEQGSGGTPQEEMRKRGTEDKKNTHTQNIHQFT